MRWNRSEIGKTFLYLLAISIMIGLISRLAAHQRNATSVFLDKTDEASSAAEGRNQEEGNPVLYATGKFQETDDMEEQKIIALTFDDGPNVYYTEQLLDGLAKRNVKATFFIIGQNAEAHPEIVQRIVEEGHMIGNHTYTHLKLTNGNTQEFQEELNHTNEIIMEITGTTPMFCRPPFGVWDSSYEKILGIIPVLWDIDPQDWCTFDARTVADRIIRNSHDCAIILLHDEYPSSVEAALIVVDELQRQGYTFVTVDKILLDP